MENFGSWSRTCPARQITTLTSDHWPAGRSDWVLTDFFHLLLVWKRDIIPSAWWQWSQQFIMPLLFLNFVQEKGIGQNPWKYPNSCLLCRYLLSLRMRCRIRGEEQADSASSPTLGTVWGFQGVPRRTSGPDQHHFRWFQVTKLPITNLPWEKIFNLSSSAATVIKKVI
jgi:hypothetical protein